MYNDPRNERNQSEHEPTNGRSIYYGIGHLNHSFLWHWAFHKLLGGGLNLPTDVLTYRETWQDTFPSLGFD